MICLDSIQLIFSRQTLICSQSNGLKYFLTGHVRAFKIDSVDVFPVPLLHLLNPRIPSAASLTLLFRCCSCKFLSPLLVASPMLRLMLKSSRLKCTECKENKQTNARLRRVLADLYANARFNRVSFCRALTRLAFNVKMYRKGLTAYNWCGLGTDKYTHTVALAEPRDHPADVITVHVLHPTHCADSPECTRQAEPKLLASLMSSCPHSFRQEVESSLFSQCVECDTAATGRHVVREIFWDVYRALMKERTHYVSNCLLHFIEKYVFLLQYIYLHFIYLCFSDFILMFSMI